MCVGGAKERDRKREREHLYTQHHIDIDIDESGIYLGICIEQPLIKVISDTTSILNLTNHVLRSSPGDTLCVQLQFIVNASAFKFI